jgi:hypothetical protein
MAYIGLIAGLGARQGLIRKIEKKLRDKGAVSKKTRVALEEVGISSRVELNMVRYLVEQGKIGKARDGKIWWKE